MNTKMNLLIIASIMTVFVVMIAPNDVIAQTDQNSINVRPINDKMSLEVTTVTMTVPENNKLPWGKVWGTASEVIERYPVIIQFYKENEPVHVAQVDTKGDGSYEYKFRARTLDHNTGESKDIFYGDYTVKIFKVIPNTNPTV
ncbi:MAG TPA: hypothetical protein HA347_02035 [Nitrosopumilus sp.]|jgi:hypothetical protein|nr:MAG: hypothetical protein ABR53_05300 [Nitrosopumilus sp. BACL13 MAG-121220-bin23]HIH99724.1 hypothetical protein [Nitrosopumilus sp.]HII04740.1 hypothetical protein [Nitrosopumilus sp.]